MARLVRYTDIDDHEYVVIVTEGEPADHRKYGYKIKEVVEIGDERKFSMFPCNVPLIDEGV